MTRPSILLVGAGGHARACIDVIEQEGKFEIGGLIGVPGEVGTNVLGYSVVGSDADIPRFAAEYNYALVTIGQIKSPQIRMRLFESLEAIGLRLPAVISPHAYVSRHAQIGVGTIVMHGAIINAGARVGRNCILNSLSLIEHDVVVGDHCHISTGAAINSAARVGDCTFIGSNSTVRQGLVIGDHCLVGMGQHALADCAPGCWMPPRKNA